MNLIEFSDSIAHILGRPFDHMLKENIMASFVGKRSLFLLRDPNAKGKFPEAAVQDLGCVPILSVDAAECCKELAGCKVLRTENRIPETIRYESKKGFLYLGNVTNKNNFEYVHPDAVVYREHARVKRKTPYYTIINQYGYVFNYVGKDIRIRDIFADPRRVIDSCSHNEQSECGELEEFPIPADLAELIKTELYKENGIVNKDGNLEIEADARKGS